MSKYPIAEEPPYFTSAFSQSEAPAPCRIFPSGATRNTDEGKYDYEGFLSPLVVQRYGEFMHKHRHLQDGTLRASDNWQQGIPRAQYAKSMFRHFMDVWLHVRGQGVHAVEPIEEALCALIFNASGLLHEVLNGRDVGNEQRT